MCKLLIWGILQRLVDGPDHIHFVLHAAASSSSGNPDVHRPAALGFEANHICTFWAFWKARFFRAKPPLPSTTSKLFIRIHPDLPRPPHCPYPAPHPWPFNISGLHDSPGVADLVEAKEEAVVGPSGMPWISKSPCKTLWLGCSLINPIQLLMRASMGSGPLPLPLPLPLLPPSLPAPQLDQVLGLVLSLASALRILSARAASVAVTLAAAAASSAVRSAAAVAQRTVRPW